MKINIVNCKNGDVLAEDVLNNNGILIAPKDTVMNEAIINQLSNLGIIEIQIHKNSVEFNREMMDLKFRRFHDTYTEHISSLEIIAYNLLVNKYLDIQDLNGISHSINSEIFENKHLIKYLYLINKFDDFTYTHSLNVSYYCALICRWLNLNENKTLTIIKTGLLHDLGKINIPINLLNKKEKLSSEEFAIIKNHAINGYNLIKDIVDLESDIKIGVLLHHEREDGSGYPFNLTGKQINLNSKIVAIADTYDAMTSDRSYRKAFSPFKAFKVLMSDNITSYDIKIVNTFIKNLQFYYLGAKVLLNSGDNGKVVFISAHNIEKPIVLVNSSLVDLAVEPELDIVGMA
jgi:HD-GYP domain-containing protein (c-di-GMP phosphodiesterase class II)